MRVALSLVIVAASATAQPFFVEDFEDATQTLDGGGNWSQIYDVVATRLRSPVSAHRGERGLQVSRAMPLMLTGADTQLERVFTTANVGESWLRWWMRVSATQLGPQAVVNFGDTTVPNHVGLAHDPLGLFVTGYEGSGAFFASRASDRPDSNWHLYELAVFGMATSDGGVRLIVDGQDTFSRPVPFGFPNPGFRQVNVGMTYGSPQSFVGSIDYDDVRASLTRPVGRLRVTAVNGPWRAGQCIFLRIDFTTSDGVLARTAEVGRGVTVTTTPALALSENSTCATDGGLFDISFAETDSSKLVYVRPSMAGMLIVSATDSDLLPAKAVVTVVDALDAGVPDAGVPDAGVPDAGVPDAGVPDARVPDAGVPDAGVPDAGVPDAGVPDAGVPDAGVPDAGVPDAGATDAGVPDAGTADAGVRPTEFAVGCGCGQVSGDALWALGHVAAALRRRSFRR